MLISVVGLQLAMPLVCIREVLITLLVVRLETFDPQIFYIRLRVLNVGVGQQQTRLLLSELLIKRHLLYDRQPVSRVHLQFY